MSQREVLGTDRLNGVGKKRKMKQKIKAEEKNFVWVKGWKVILSKGTNNEMKVAQSNKILLQYYDGDIEVDFNAMSR